MGLSPDESAVERSIFGTSPRAPVSLHRIPDHMPEDDRLVSLLADLVRVNTVNPAYGDGGTEANLLPYLRDYFVARGIRTSEQEVFPGRSNLLASLPGRTARRLLLEAHMDTVSIRGMTIPPFEPRIAGGRFYGRGAVDDKAGLAAMMHALASLKEQGVVPPCEICLAAVVDEEHAFRGVAKLCESVGADGAVVAEPTELRVVIASKGVLRCRFETLGRSAHSARPHLGNNAIAQMARLVTALVEENDRLGELSHPLLGSATMSVGTVRGGVQVNLVPDRCEIEVDRRLLPGERVADVLEHWNGILDRLRRTYPGFEGRIMTPLLLVDEALETPGDASIVTAARKVLREFGRDGVPVGVPFGCDASKLSRAGIPTIVFGPGSIDQAHTAEEYVELEQVRSAAEFYRRLMTEFE
jgi:acetylornithine deacetylase/succinyl-diaminopimelate desuccinylase family protein